MSEFYLYHMTHIDNLNSILTYGLLCHNLARQKGFIKTDISMPEAQRWRSHLHDFVPLYFNPRNTMLYKRLELQNNIIMLAINPDVLEIKTTRFTDGNAASNSTKIYDYRQTSQFSSLPWDIIFSDSWNHPDPEIKQEYKRIMCAEVLVYNSISIDKILKILCRNTNLIPEIINLIPSDLQLPVEVDSSLYF